MKKNKELDLDNFKESWKKEDSSTHTYSQAELVLMLNKKSTNNVKYIVIISIIEFVFILLSLFLTSSDKIVLDGLDPEAQQIYLRNAKISQYLSYANVVMTFMFIFYFYNSYKKINVLNTTKEFINNILKFRKIVTIFIIINIFLGIVVLFLTGYYTFMAGFRIGYTTGSNSHVEIEKVHTPLSSPEYMFLFVIICLVIIAFVIIYYLLIYGILLRKLKINLKELQKLGIDKE